MIISANHMEELPKATLYFIHPPRVNRRIVDNVRSAKVFKHL
jgi:hypothetical protein